MLHLSVRHIYRIQQESPPAWTQEACRSRCIKYSICCPILGEGYPIPGWGIPHPWMVVGYPPSRGGVPHPGYPCLIWPGGTPSLDRGTPRWVPISWSGQEWGTPRKGHGTSGSIMGWRPRKDMGPVEALQDGRGIPPFPSAWVWTDWKHNLPSSTTYAVAKNRLWKLGNFLKRFQDSVEKHVKKLHFYIFEVKNSLKNWMLWFTLLGSKYYVFILSQ